MHITVVFYIRGEFRNHKVTYTKIVVIMGQPAGFLVYNDCCSTGKIWNFLHVSRVPLFLYAFLNLSCTFHENSRIVYRIIGALLKS